MAKVLVDYNGEKIKTNDIVGRENLETGETVYFLYEEITNDKGVLYQYDKYGKIDNKNIMNNIYLDNGVNIVSNYMKRWIRIGFKEEVYDEIFNK